MNEIIANEKDINDGIFWDYFKYQNPSFLAKDLIRSMQAKNEKLVNNVNDRLMDLRTILLEKKFLKIKTPKKKVDILKKIHDFSKQQKRKGIKMLTPKQMHTNSICTSKNS